MRVTILGLVIVLGTISCAPSPDAKEHPASAATRPKVVRQALDFTGLHFGDRLKKGDGVNCDDTPLAYKTAGILLCFVEHQRRLGNVIVIESGRTYLDSSLISFRMSFMGEEYPAMLAALTAKYGEPDSTVRHEIQDEKLGSVPWLEKFWNFADGWLGFSEPALGSYAGLYAHAVAGRAEYARRDSTVKANTKAEAAASLLKDLGGPHK